MYLSAHIILHFILNEAFVNPALPGLGIATKPFPVISAGEEEWTIQVIIIRL